MQLAIGQVTRWRTSDGVEHETEALAVKHVQFQALAEKLDKDLYLREDVDPQDVLKWITVNKAAILKFLA